MPLFTAWLLLLSVHVLPRRRQFDMLKLRNELVSLCTVDSIRRVATECVVPMIVQVNSFVGGWVAKLHGTLGVGGLIYVLPVDCGQNKLHDLIDGLHALLSTS